MSSCYRNLLISFLLLSLSAQGQKGHFRNYSLREGLGNSQVTSMLQDSRGYLWIGTWDGLSRFDGKTFTNYTVNDGLVHNHVTSLFEDSKRRLWIGTHKGVSVLSGQSFRNVTAADGIYDERVYKIFEDLLGRIWIQSWPDFYKGYLSIVDENFKGKLFEFSSDTDSVRSAAVRGMNIVVTDYQGNIWISKKGGISMIPLLRSSDKTISVPEKESLPSDYITIIFPTRAGDVWIGTAKGACRVKNSEQNKLQLYCYSKGDGLAGEHIYDIAEDDKKRIWIATNEAVAMYDPVKNSFRSIPLSEISPLRISNRVDENYLCFYKDKENSIWLTQSACNYKLNSKSPGTTLFVRFTERVNEISREIFMIDQCMEGVTFRESGDGRIYFISDNAVAEYNPRRSNYDEAFIDSMRFKLLPTDVLHRGAIRSCIIDTESNLWIGHYGGGLTMKHNHIFDKHTADDGLSDNTVWSILEDANGDMMFGTNAGGINWYDGAHFKKLTRKEGLLNNFVGSMVMDHTGNIWLGNIWGVVKLMPDKRKYTGYSVTKPFHAKVDSTFSYGGIWAMLEDGNRNIWIGTYGRGVKRYNSELKELKTFTVVDGLAADYVQGLFEDSQGRMWMARGGIGYGFERNGGISVFYPDRENGEPFEVLTIDEGLPDRIVFSIREDKSGNFWMATRNGLARYKPAKKNSVKGGTFQTFRKKDGLSADNIQLLQFDNDSTLWIGTTSGVDRIVLDAGGNIKRIRNYGYEDGFFASAATENASFKDKRGDLWFGTFNGVAKYNRHEDFESNTPPKIHITNLLLDHKTVDWRQYGDSINYETGLPQDLKLRYDQNQLSFEFVGINFRLPERVRYSYRLVGLEGTSSSWSPPQSEQRVAFQGLPAGNYTFEVKACNSNGLWNVQPATFQFVINPPFWETAVFRTILAGIVIMALSALYSHRRRTTKIREQYLEEQIKIRTAEVHREKQKVEESEREKQRFLENTSHEVRNNLNALVGYLDELKNTHLSGKQSMLIHNSNTFVNHILSLLNDLLDLAKINARMMEIKDETFSVSECLMEIKGAIEHRARNKKLKFTYIPQFDKLYDRVVGDKVKLRHVLHNLLENALKFTGQGGITFIVETGACTADSIPFVFTIKDTGIGISKENISRIFKSFVQLNNDKEFSGTGIGLSLSKEMILMMNGSIEVESEIGVGSTFILRIPFKIGSKDKSLRPERESDLEKVRFRPIEVLVVENDKPSREKLMRDLRGLSRAIKIDLAINGKEAIENTKLNNYDLVFMDVNMPVMDGLEATRYIRSELSDPIKRKTVIIGLSASASAKHVQACYDAGMTYFLSKPANRKTLLAAMVKNLPDDKYITETQKKSPRNGQDDVLNEKQNLNMVIDFIQLSAVDIEWMKKACKDADWKELEILAHDLKGRSDIAGQRKISGMAGEIELLNNVGNENNENVMSMIEKIDHEFRRASIAMLKRLIRTNLNSHNNGKV